MRIIKKHIIIAGVPRAGKSTVSKRIVKNYGYQHISMDSVIAGIEKTFPETGVDTNASDRLPEDNLRYISSKMGPFIRAMMNSGEYNECDYGMVLDIHQLLPEDYVKYIDPKICDIYYFITSDVTPEERFELLKRYDTPDDYTYYHSDEENYQDCVDIVELSKLFKTQCETYHLPYYETTNDRLGVIDAFIKKLGEKTNEE